MMQSRFFKWTPRRKCNKFLAHKYPSLSRAKDKQLLPKSKIQRISSCICASTHNKKHRWHYRNRNYARVREE